jgi:hypothetical protein
VDNHDPTVQPARVGLLELQLGKAQKSHCRLSAPWRCGLFANSSWVISNTSSLTGAVLPP